MSVFIIPYMALRVLTKITVSLSCWQLYILVKFLELSSLRSHISSLSYGGSPCLIHIQSLFGIMSWWCKWLPHPYLPLHQWWKSKALTQALWLGMQHNIYQWCRIVYFYQLTLFLWKFCLFYILETGGSLVPHRILLCWWCMGLVVKICY